jgi:hypothetical protein
MMEGNAKITSRRWSATKRDDKALYTKSAAENETIQERGAAIRRDEVVFELETMWRSWVIPFLFIEVLYTGLLYYKNHINGDI